MSWSVILKSPGGEHRVDCEGEMDVYTLEAALSTLGSHVASKVLNKPHMTFVLKARERPSEADLTRAARAD